MKKKNSHRIGSLLALCFLLIVIISSSNQISIVSRGIVLAAAAKPAVVDKSDDSALNEASIANCRYGVAGTTSNVDEAPIISDIGAGWFLNFQTKWQGPNPSNNAEYVRLLWVSQKKTKDGIYLPDYRTGIPLNNNFAALIQDNPGTLWLIGNEVERGPDTGQLHGGQGDMYPEIYALAYHDIRSFIKRYDPTARTAVSGLVQVTPGRLQYLEKVWDAYQQQFGTTMPVDVWNMHVYVLPEVKPDGVTPNSIANIALGTNPALGKRSSGGDWRQCTQADVYCSAEHDDLAAFGGQVLAMRQWMKEHGQQQKPLILSEYSILYSFYNTGGTCAIQDEYGDCFTPDRVSSFMTRSFNYLNNLQDQELGYTLDENRLVQQWLWFSLYYTGPGNASNILKADLETLTQAGKTFKQVTHAEAAAVNLVAEKIPTTALPIGPSGRATATIQATFRNNGNSAVEAPFEVSFYEDAARNRKIGSVTIDSAVRGCATGAYTAAVEWQDLPPGRHRFWVTIDSNNAIEESLAQDADNRASGVVVVYPESSVLPVIVR